jgi:hypothetical protein
MDHSNPWPRRVLWLVLSALTTGAIFLVIAAILRVTREESPDTWWPRSPFEALFAVGLMGAISLPWLVAYAFVMLRLAKRRRASLLASLLIGGSFGFTSFLILGWTISEVSQPDIVDTTGGFAMSAIPALLYWWFVVRKEREIAERQARDTAAIAAME